MAATYTVEKFCTMYGQPETWNVVGPYPPVPHCRAFWACRTQEEAERLAEKMNNGFVPDMDDET